MNDIDDKILEAICTSQTDVKTSEIEATTLHLLGRSFRGMFRFTAIAVIALQLIFIGLAVWFSYMMFNAQQLDLKIEWSISAIACFIVFVALRIWLFMELNRLSVLREVKRVELQIALLSEALMAKKEQNRVK